MPRLRLIAIPLLALWLAAAAPDPGNGPGPALGSVTKLPVPRFVSLRSDEVNFRAGPGFQYPVNWIYQREGLPVEIIGEFDVWRQVLAPDGGTGWVHEATIRALRGFYVTVEKAALRSAPGPGAPIVAYLQEGVTGRLLRCPADGDYCKVSTKYETGYLARSDFWGTFPGEAVKP
ncbi:SH3 domain-containing protein [Acidocella sp.]|uniref:SH3 domain-containing protein n=1 Tax=Acidocella sp. TaxID=50710 RepID=UPI002637EBE9|nr:SH3 domain-containing protein [Acidocella sp.]